MKQKSTAIISASIVIAQLFLGGCSLFGEAAPEPATAAAPARPAGGVLDVAEKLNASGDHDAAAALYLGEYRRNPQNLRAVLGLAESLRLSGKCEAATAYYGEAQTLDPGNPEILTGHGRCAIALDRPELAARLLSEAVDAVDAPDPALLSAAGIARDLVGDHDGAQMLYRRGLTAEPGRPGLTANLALSLSLQGRFEEAADLLHAKADAPSASAADRQNLALVLALAGDYGEALRYGRMDLSAADARRNVETAADLALDLYGSDPVRSAAARRVLLAPSVRS